MIGRFLHNRQGATSIEYALIGCLVSIAIVAGAAGIGTKISDIFATVVKPFQ